MSGTSSALSGEEGAVYEDINLCMSDAVRHTNAHLLGHEFSDVIGKQRRVFLLLI